MRLNFKGVVDDTQFILQRTETSKSLFSKDKYATRHCTENAKGWIDFKIVRKKKMPSLPTVAI